MAVTPCNGENVAERSCAGIPALMTPLRRSSSSASARACSVSLTSGGKSISPSLSTFVDNNSWTLSASPMSYFLTTRSKSSRTLNFSTSLGMSATLVGLYCSYTPESTSCMRALRSASTLASRNSSAWRNPASSIATEYLSQIARYTKCSFPLYLSSNASTSPSFSGFPTARASRMRFLNPNASPELLTGAKLPLEYTER